jgi:hypothetical protein
LGQTRPRIGLGMSGLERGDGFRSCSLPSLILRRLFRSRRYPALRHSASLDTHRWLRSASPRRRAEYPISVANMVLAVHTYRFRGRPSENRRQYAFQSVSILARSRTSLWATPVDDRERPVDPENLGDDVLRFRCSIIGDEGRCCREQVKEIDVLPLKHPSAKAPQSLHCQLLVRRS